MSATVVAPPSSNGKAPSDELRKDVADIAKCVQSIQTVERELNLEVIESRDFIRIVVLAVLSRTHVFVRGEGGVGKSYAADRLMARMPGKTFRTQMSKDMTRDELYGPFDIGALTDADGKGVRLERDMSGMLGEANLAIGEEFADAGTMIARSLLSPLNERTLRDGRVERQIPLWSFIATANFWITQRELAALFDRLAQRYVQQRVTSSEGRKAILRGGIERRANGGKQPSVPVTQLSALELAVLHNAVDTTPVPEDILTAIDQLIVAAEDEGLIPSIRRMQEGIKLAQANAVLNGRSVVTDEDLIVYKFVLPDGEDDFDTAADLCSQFVGKVAQAIGDLRKSFAQPHAAVEKLRADVAAAKQGPEADRRAALNAAMQGIGEISDALAVAHDEVAEKIAEFEREGRDAGELRTLIGEIQHDQKVAAEMVFGKSR